MELVVVCPYNKNSVMLNSGLKRNKCTNNVANMIPVMTNYIGSVGSAVFNEATLM